MYVIDKCKKLKEGIEKKFIEIIGAETHNLKNISIKIPKNKLIVISGVSGSGKSSLAFDTLFAEGQRRYIESLSSYARQFLGKIEKPKVKDIKGICPTIAIEQKTNTNNSRSTVATNTEIYDYLKLLFSRIGKIYSPISKKEVKKHYPKDIFKFIKNQNEEDLIFILVKNNKLIKNDLQLLINKGYSRILHQGNIYKIKELVNKKIDLTESYIIIDRIKNHSNYNEKQIIDSIETALNEGNGTCYIKNNKEITFFSNTLKLDGKTFIKPSVKLFSFNNAYGACENCNGFGSVLGIDKRKIIKNVNLSIYDGVVSCWHGEKLSKWKDNFIKNSLEFNFPIHRQYKELNDNELDILWNGKNKCKGIYQFFNTLEKDKYKIQNRVLIARYRGKTKCESCNGNRLRKEALYIKINNKHIADISSMNIIDAINFFKNIKLDKHEKVIAKRIIMEIQERLKYLKNIGLPYINLNRESNTLSGGEFQRINIAKSISSSLVGAMYILDEPSIGLHPRDTKQLIKILKDLRDIGNTVIIVEHDDEIIKEADYLIDIGPNAGVNGGKITYKGKLNNLNKSKESLTIQYISKKLNIHIPNKKRKLKEYIEIINAHKYNLKNINIRFPLNGLVVVSGVSGSGKSTLVRDILERGLKKEINNSHNEDKYYDKIHISNRNIKKIEFIDQNPIGKSSRSNPITYIKAYDDIRKLFSRTPLANSRGYNAGFFSFNTDGGRCDHCKGEGEIKIEMQFMADVNILCKECQGARFKKEILDIKFKNKNINDILNLSVEEAICFFNKTNQEKIAKKIIPLENVGLNYIKLGQSSNTLSGGEAQRIKLASFLSKGNTDEKTLFIFDEPTTGLHIHDIKKLLKSFDSLIEKGHSIICIEHNLHVIKCADWIIDIGPEGGEKGGEIIFSGTPENLSQCNNSLTGKYLKKSNV